MYGPDSNVYDKDLANYTPTSESDRTTTHAPSTAAAPSPTKNLGRILYSPVVNIAVLMTIMALAVVQKMFVFICDVKGAFLYAELFENEYVYVRPPPNWKDHLRFKGKTMKLKKALYGLRQAPRRWYTTLT